MTVRLTILRGNNAGRSYDFDEDIITVGSGRNNQLVIHDNDVATLHCRFVRLAPDYDIEDFSSQYGERYATYVNGQRIRDEKWLVSSGAIIELGGHVTLEYRLLDNPQEQTRGPIFMHAGDPGSQPCLVLVEDANIKAAFLMQSLEIFIGRSSDNDIIIGQNDISRNHAKLLYRDGRYHIEDLQSRNGTFVNGVAITTPMMLNHSDVIRLGALTQLHYVYRADLPESWDPIPADGAVVPLDDHDTARDSTLPYMAAPRRDGTREIAMDVERGALLEHIMLVYAREDWEDIVAAMVLNLDDAKQKVWVDQYLRPGSDAWKIAVDQAQTECWLLVVVMSPDALKSNYVRDIYRYFFNREKPILLVDYKAISRVPFELEQAISIEFDRDSPGKMFRRLLHEIMKLKPRYSNG